MVEKWKWIVGWVGGSILYVFLSSIQQACVNSPVFLSFKLLVFCRDVSYSPADILVETPIFYIRNN